MYDWEGLAGNLIGRTAELGLQFGAAYGNSWLANNQLEAQLELAARYRPAVPQSNPMLLIIIVAAVVILARK